jgi:hypothetical protein
MSSTVSLAVEGLLDEKVLRQVIAGVAADRFRVTACYGKRGRDELAKGIPRFNQAAHIQPFIILADLERDDCAPAVRNTWLPQGAHPNLLLRIAVRKVESWLAADRQACADFLGVPLTRLPQRADDEPDPKLLIVNLARRSRNRRIRDSLVPAEGSTSLVGKNYAGELTQFILNDWNPLRAQQYSESLARAIRALSDFNPVIKA